MNPQQYVKKLLRETHLVQLATVGPWICTVFCIAGEDGALYWASLPASRHSHALNDSARCAVAIVVQPKPQIGLQAEGEAVELRGVELEMGLRIYGAALGKDSAWRQAFLDGTHSHRLYRFKADSWKLYDMQTQPDAPYSVVSL